MTDKAPRQTRGRDTGTGRNYEMLIAAALAIGKLEWQQQADVGLAPTGKRHRVDYVAWKPGEPDRKVLVSCKVQNTSGTAEEKLPFEIIKLLYTMQQHPEYVKAYLIMGGTGFDARMVQFVRNGLKDFIRSAEAVTILNTDELITKGITVPPDDPSAAVPSPP